MNRRTLLAGTGTALSASVVGCVDQLDAEAANGDDGAVTPFTGTPVALGADCGPADRPLSALLTEETGDAWNCHEGATPSFALENEREEALTVAIALQGEADGEEAGENDEIFAETYSLDPGERVVESSAFEAQADLTGTVRIDDEETRVRWPERSCYRHGVALTADGVEIGLVEPLSGPGDTGHDCYAGDDATLSVYSADEARTVTVTVTDRCAREVTTETFDVEPDEREWTRGVLTNGGVYDVEFALEDGRTKSSVFNEACWGVEFGVDEDGEVRIHRLSID